MFSLCYLSSLKCHISSLSCLDLMISHITEMYEQIKINTTQELYLQYRKSLNAIPIPFSNTQPQTSRELPQLLLDIKHSDTSLDVFFKQTNMPNYCSIIYYFNFICKQLAECPVSTLSKPVLSVHSLTGGGSVQR